MFRITFGDNGARISNINPNTKYKTEENKIINHDELSFVIPSLNIVSEMVNSIAIEAATIRFVRKKLVRKG
jgi:hypothetical protein